MKSMESRLRLAFLCVVLLLAIQGVVAYRNIVAISKTQQRVYEQRLAINDVENRLSDVRLQVFKILGTMNPRQMDALHGAYGHQVGSLRRDLTRLGIEAADVARHFDTYDRIISLQYDFSVRTAAALINGESKNLHESLVARLRALSQATRDRSEARIAAAYQRTFFITFGLLLLALATAFVWAFVLARTLTDRRKAEAEREKLQAQLQQSHKMEAVGTLAGGVAHEFNNMLSVVVGNAELAREDLPPEHPVQTFVDEIYRTSLRGRDVVRQLLAFTRPSAPQRRTIDVGSIADEAVRLLRASMPADVELVLASPPEPAAIVGDPTQIHQVLINLCNNAMHAMEETGGKIEIGVARRLVESSLRFMENNLPAGEYVCLQVKDDGSGIPPEHLNRVCDPFFTTKEVGRGSGMGLTVVHGIVRGHGGGIRIESTPGTGTLVECCFPAVDDLPAADVPRPPALPGGHERILVVDDEAQIVNVIRMQLERIGYRVESRTDPQEALELFETAAETFDLVISDWSMPGMNGDTVIRRVRELRPEVRTVICTGYNEKIDDARRESLGADALLIKPVAREELARTLRQVLDRLQ